MRNIVADAATRKTCCCQVPRDQLLFLAGKVATKVRKVHHIIPTMPDRLFTRWHAPVQTPSMLSIRCHISSCWLPSCPNESLRFDLQLLLALMIASSGLLTIWRPYQRLEAWTLVPFQSPSCDRSWISDASGDDCAAACTVSRLLARSLLTKTTTDRQRNPLSFLMVKDGLY